MCHGALRATHTFQSLRQARGTPIYRRTEPVLCYGYQHMYTYVYKCLTAHNTIIHSEQVDWIMDAPLGQMLESIDLAKDMRQANFV